MGFEVYVPKSRGKKQRVIGAMISIGKKGSMYVSGDLCRQLKLAKGQTCEIAFDKAARKIRIMFLGGASPNALYLQPIGKEKTFCINSEHAFKSWGLSYPAQVLRIKPFMDGKVAILDYPEVLCPA